MTDVQRRLIGWLPAVAWAATLFLFSSAPSLPTPADVGDKVMHGGAYAVLGALCLLGITGWRWHSITLASALVAWLVATMYGVTDEVHQSFVPGRTPDVGDVVADAMGAALAVGLLWAWAILARRRSSPPRP